MKNNNDRFALWTLTGILLLFLSPFVLMAAVLLLVISVAPIGGFWQDDLWDRMPIAVILTVSTLLFLPPAHQELRSKRWYRYLTVLSFVVAVFVPMPIYLTAWTFHGPVSDDSHMRMYRAWEWTGMMFWVLGLMLIHLRDHLPKQQRTKIILLALGSYFVSTLTVGNRLLNMWD